MDKRCKILFLVTESWYFLSHRLALARACRDHGWDVVVATRVSPEWPIDEPGIRVVPLTMRRTGRNPIEEVVALVQLYRMLRREQPDIVHAVGLKPVLYAATVGRFAGIRRMVAALAGMGYIFMSASLRIGMIRAALVRWLRLALRRRGVWLILQNGDDADMLIGGGVVTASQVRIIRGSGVDLDYFQPEPEPDGPVVFAVVSRMLTDKGICEVVWASREMQRLSLPVTVQLVGSPDLDNPTSLSEAQLRSWHAEGCIQWLGQQSDICAIWRQAHVCVLPSYREGLPKTLLEAAACGRPIITTDVPGCREVVRPEVDGLLVPVENWTSLAAAMIRLAASPELRREFGANARQLAEAEFGSEAIIAQVISLYDHILADCP
ncbi:MAG: glycosyltransferase family 4 protein [Phaeospirillum sp.]|nr:glycosyltransferase family 4 protein [Phaeospirillum sp.]